MISIGNRIFTRVERPDPKVVELFRGLPSSNINDEMNRLFCMHDYIRLLNPATARPLLGTAITVHSPIGDNLFFHQALDMAQPGDIIVVDAGSGCNRSVAGEIMMRFAAKRGWPASWSTAACATWTASKSSICRSTPRASPPQGP